MVGMDWAQREALKERDGKARLAVAARDAAALMEPWSEGPSARDRELFPGLLAMAVRQGWLEGVKALLEAGADPNWVERVSDEDRFGPVEKRGGAAPLSYALAQGFSDVEDALVAAGASYSVAGRDVLDALWDKAGKIGWKAALEGFSKAFEGGLDPLERSIGSSWLSAGFNLARAGRSEDDKDAFCAWLKGLVKESGPLPDGASDALFHLRMGGAGTGAFPRWAARRAVLSKEDRTEVEAIGWGWFASGICAAEEGIVMGALDALVETDPTRGPFGCPRLTKVDESNALDCSFAKRQWEVARSMFSGFGGFFDADSVRLVGMRAACKGHAGLLRAALEAGAPHAEIIEAWRAEDGLARRESDKRSWDVPGVALRMCARELAIAASQTDGTNGASMVWESFEARDRMSLLGRKAASEEERSKWLAGIEGEALDRLTMQPREGKAPSRGAGL